MASWPGSTLNMEYQVFLCIFQKNSAMATLDLKKMGKFLLEGRDKRLPCWPSQFRKTKLRQPTGQTGHCLTCFQYQSNRKQKCIHFIDFLLKNGLVLNTEPIRYPFFPSFILFNAVFFWYFQRLCQTYQTPDRDLKYLQIKRGGPGEILSPYQYIL